MCTSDIRFCSLPEIMEGRVVLYLKEAGLTCNLFLASYKVRCCVLTCVCNILESTPHVECTQATSVFRLVMSFFTIRKQLRHHQFLVHSQASHNFCCLCSACAMAHTSILNRAVPYILVCKPFEDISSDVQYT